MSAHSPPTLSRRAKIALGAVLVLTFAYSVVVAGQILIWFVIAGVAAGLYVTWLFVLAVFRLVEAVERLAAAKEAEVHGSDGDNSQNAASIRPSAAVDGGSTEPVDADDDDA